MRRVREEQTDRGLTTTMMSTATYLSVNRRTQNNGPKAVLSGQALCVSLHRGHVPPDRQIGSRVQQGIPLLNCDVKNAMFFWQNNTTNDR